MKKNNNYEEDDDLEKPTILDMYMIRTSEEIWDTHYHEEITEINLLTKGKMTLQNKELNTGDIFILEPFEIADPVFLEDCDILCVKYPGIKGDKVIVRKWMN